MQRELSARGGGQRVNLLGSVQKKVDYLKKKNKKTAASLPPLHGVERKISTGLQKEEENQRG